jgi:hypothetical protein
MASPRELHSFAFLCRLITMTYIKIQGPDVVFLSHGIAAPSLLLKIVLVVSGK